MSSLFYVDTRGAGREIGMGGGSNVYELQTLDRFLSEFFSCGGFGGWGGVSRCRRVLPAHFCSTGYSGLAEILADGHAMASLLGVALRDVSMGHFVA